MDFKIHILTKTNTNSSQNRNTVAIGKRIKVQKMLLGKKSSANLHYEEAILIYCYNSVSCIIIGLYLLSTNHKLIIDLVFTD